MKFEGSKTCLSVHSSTRKRVHNIVESFNFNSAEELINYLLDLYFEEKEDQETKDARS